MNLRSSDRREVMPRKSDDKNVPWVHPGVAGKVIPQSIEAEKSLLCCLMEDSNVAIELISALNEDDFYLNAHKFIIAAMKKIWESNRPIDFAIVTTQLDTEGHLADVGGAEYIASLSSHLPGYANYKTYFDIVKKRTKLRKLMTAANEIMVNCYEGDPEDRALVFAEKAITDVAESQGLSALTPFNEALAEASEEFDKINSDPYAYKGLQTGFPDVDKKLGSLGEGDLIIIAARPGVGKTSLGMNIITNIALSHLNEKGNKIGEKKVCAIFSLEMPAKQLAKRMLCSKAHVSFSKAQKGELGTDKRIWKDLADAETVLNSAKIFVDDQAMTTPVEILSKCRRIKREQGRLDVVIVDYLTLMSSGKKTENRQQEVSEISRSMKLAAKELGVPILLLSQLSRESEKNKRRPILSDLRESGAIEQDADIIMFIHRPGDFDKTVKYKDKVELIIAKHRNGELGTAYLKWVGEEVSFRDAPPEYIESSSNAASSSEQSAAQSK